MVWIEPGTVGTCGLLTPDQCVGSFTARGAQIRAPPPLAGEETANVM